MYRSCSQLQNITFKQTMVTECVILVLKLLVLNLLVLNLLVLTICCFIANPIQSFVYDLHFAVRKYFFTVF